MTMKFGITHEGMHVDQLLSNFAVGYRPQGDQIAEMIAPVVEVPKQSDTYLIYDRADTLRIRSSERAPRTEANRIDRTMSSGTFYAKNYALQYPVTIEEKSNMDPAYVQALYNERVGFTIDQLFMGWEDRVASTVTSTSNVGSSAAVSSSWTDATNANPLGDINTAIDNVQDATGYRPNLIVMSDLAWRLVRRNTTIRNLIFGTNNGGGYPSRDQFRNLIEIENFGVGGMFKNTANEAKTEVLTRIWGAHVFIGYCPQGVSRDAPAYMKSFRWTAPGLPNMMVERHPYDTKRKEESLEVGYYQDEKVTASQYSFLIRGVNSST
jgi:hypothetical protein